MPACFKRTCPFAFGERCGVVTLPFRAYDLGFKGLRGLGLKALDWVAVKEYKVSYNNKEPL